MTIEQLIQDNTGLVYKQLHKFNKAFDDDAVSYAFEALWRAAKTYDESKGAKFSTYASVCIYNEIALYLRKEQQRLKLDVVSYDNPIEDSTFLYFIKSDDDVEKALVDTEKMDKVTTAFINILDSLSSETARKIILRWAELDFDVKQSVLAKEFNVSQSAVSRTINNFRYKLRTELEESK